MSLGLILLWLTVPVSPLIGAYAGRNRMPELLVAWCCFVVGLAVVVLFSKL